MADKICPNCGKRYKGLAKFCTKCGVEFEKDKNRCSEQSTSLCKEAVFEENDIFCAYCGALTTFAKEQQDRGAIIPKP